MAKAILGGWVGVLMCLLLVMVPSHAGELDPKLFAQSFTPKRSSETISPLELQQFVQALKQLQGVEMETQQKIMEALKKERLSPERFQEIGQRQRNPDFSSAEISPTDQQKFDKAVEKIQTIQQEALPKQRRAIVLQGLTVERFSQIGRAIEQNPTLKQQLQNSRF